MVKSIKNIIFAWVIFNDEYSKMFGAEHEILSKKIWLVASGSCRES